MAARALADAAVEYVVGQAADAGGFILAGVAWRGAGQADRAALGIGGGISSHGAILAAAAVEQKITGKANCAAFVTGADAAPRWAVIAYSSAHTAIAAAGTDCEALARGEEEA